MPEAKWNTEFFYYSSTSWSIYLAPDGMTGNKPSHIPSNVPSGHHSGSSSVFMIVHPSTLSNITPTTLPSGVPSEKPMILVL